MHYGAAVKPGRGLSERPAFPCTIPERLEAIVHQARLLVLE